MIDFSKYIKIYREKNFLTQSAFAKILKVSETTVNRWENGKFKPAMEYRKELYDLFIKSGLIRR